MKWLPDPSDPSWLRQRGVAGGVELLRGGELLQLGDARLGGRDDRAVVAARRQRDRSLDLLAQRHEVAREQLRFVNCVRTAIMPQPMSTPTAAGMMAPSVGMTEPTVAPLPRCASGMSARCG